MPEGDTIAWTANRIRPVLEGRVLDEISSPRNPRWPERLALPLYDYDGNVLWPPGCINLRRAKMKRRSV